MIIILLCSGCGEEPVQLDIAGTTGVAGALKGIWASGCVVIPEARRVTTFGKSVRRESTFTQDLLTEVTRLYSDEVCDNRSATITRTMTYVVLEPTPDDDTINFFQTQFQSGLINFTSGSFALKVNTDKLCGTGIFFERNEDTFVVDQDCDLVSTNTIVFPPRGGFLFDLVQVDKKDGQDRIRFGDLSTGDGKTETTRPTTILPFEQLRTAF